MKYVIVVALLLVGCNVGTNGGNSEREVFSAADSAYPKEVCLSAKSMDGTYENLDGKYCIRRIKEDK